MDSGRRIFCLGLALLTLVALFYRVPMLGARPMHQDEAIHADKFQTLWETGRYVYDPHEYHGPTLNYFTLPVMWLTGIRTYAESTEFMYRIVPAIFGAMLVMGLARVGEGMGRSAAIVAGLLTAISPAMTFYSRYYIQEMLLVFFTFGAMAAGWSFAVTGKRRWCLAAGCMFGLMYATKETWIIAAGAMGMALPMAMVWGRWVDGGRWGEEESAEEIAARPLEHLADGTTVMRRAGIVARPLDYAGGGTRSRPGALSRLPTMSEFIRVHWCIMLVGIAVGLGVAALFFSGFFTNVRGVVDAVRTYTTYFNRGRGGEAVHNHPWNYYLELLTYYRYRPGRGPIHSEGLILGLAVVGFVAALLPSRRAGGLVGRRAVFVRFLAFYTLAMVILYSAIPYKTPWCMLSFLHGMILLAGVGGAWLIACVRWMWWRVVVSVVLAAGAGQLAYQDYRINFVSYADARLNPYLYANPTLNFLDLPRQIDAVAAFAPGEPLIDIVTADCWPLPFYLRKYRHVEYWEKELRKDADVVVGAPGQEAYLSNELAAGFVVQRHSLRNKVPITVFFRRELWEKFQQSRTKK